MRTRYIDIGIYKTHLQLFLGGGMADISRWLDENISDDKEEASALTENFRSAIEDDEANGAFVWYGREYFVWVKHPNHISELVHELYHATNYICKTCGVSEDLKNEAQAYLLEYLVYEALKKEPKNT